MALGGSTGPVLGTNPLAYAVPGQAGRRSSSTKPRPRPHTSTCAMRPERPSPSRQGGAVGPDGAATTDAAQAMCGALLPFGGYRGGNIALLVEFLATLAGASFSIDAPPFDRGQAPPGIGVFVLCMNLDVIAEGPTRVTQVLDRLHSARGVSLPAMTDEAPTESIRLDATLHQRLLATCAEPDPGQSHGRTAQKNGEDR
jgi:(2R)-3-sulfolactate dehydrogenase (NADP+)